MSNSQITTLIADDHPLVRFGLNAYLGSNPKYQVIGEASNGLEAYNKILSLQPDLAIIDIVMPKMNGFEVVEKLNGFSLKPKIILITAVEEFINPRDVFKSSVNGVILKDISKNDFFKVLDLVLDGNIVYSNTFFLLSSNIYPTNSNKKNIIFSEIQQKIISLRLNGYHFSEISSILNLDFSTLADEISKLLDSEYLFEFVIKC